MVLGRELRLPCDLLFGASPGPGNVDYWLCSQPCWATARHT
jgi:hypothetical protein